MTAASSNTSNTSKFQCKNIPSGLHKSLFSPAFTVHIKEETDFFSFFGVIKRLLKRVQWVHLCIRYQAVNSLREIFDVLPVLGATFQYLEVNNLF